jgi:hypothetical protein
MPIKGVSSDGRRGRISRSRPTRSPAVEQDSTVSAQFWFHENTQQSGLLFLGANALLLSARSSHDTGTAAPDVTGPCVLAVSRGCFIVARIATPRAVTVGDRVCMSTAMGAQALGAAKASATAASQLPYRSLTLLRVQRR